MIYAIDTPTHQSGNINILGVTGFDTITLKGFDIPEKFTEPIAQNCPFLMRSPMLPDNDNSITIRPSQVIISGENYQLTFGNKNNAAFMNLKLFSCNKSEINLKNMRVSEVVRNLEGVKTDLFERFRFALPYTYRNIQIQHCEINVTFPTEAPYHDYYRVRNLLSKAFAEREKKQKEPKEEHKRARYETLAANRVYEESTYFTQGQTIKVFCYNKSKEICDTDDTLDCDDVFLTRFEIASRQQNLRSLCREASDDGKVYLCKVDDDSVKRYFVQYFRGKFDIIEDYLKAQKAKFSLLPAVSASDNAMESISVLGLEYALTHEPMPFCKHLLSTLYTKEQEGYPLLLDILDVEESISGSSLSERCRTVLQEQFTQIRENPSLSDEVCKKFIGQRKMYEELKQKILNPEEYFFFNGFLYPHIPRQVVWFGNPRHTSYLVTYTNPDRKPDDVPEKARFRRASTKGEFCYYLTAREVSDNRYSLIASIDCDTVTDFFSDIDMGVHDDYTVKEENEAPVEITKPDYISEENLFREEEQCRYYIV